MKSIRNYIVRTDVKEADDQKKPKITTPCYSCRKTCHLISRDETRKNIHNGQKIKKWDGKIAEQQTLFKQQDVKHMVTFILATLKRNWEKNSANTGTMPKTADNNQPAAHIHKHQHEFDKDIEVMILKWNLYQKHERELWEDKFIRLLGSKAPAGINIEFKHYGRTISSAFSEQFCFRRLDEMSVFCGVPPPLTFFVENIAL